MAKRPAPPPPSSKASKARPAVDSILSAAVRGPQTAAKLTQEQLKAARAGKVV